MKNFFLHPIESYRSSIRIQFTVLITLLAIISVVILGAVIIAFSANQVNSALEADAIAKLEQARTLKVNALNAYLNERSGDVTYNSSIPLTQEALNAFDNGFSLSDASTVRSLYLKKPDLASAADGGGYSTAHGKYSPFLSELTNSYGYFDTFLINRDGQVIYTHSKEDDFGTNLKNGPYAKTNLAEVFNAAMKLPQGKSIFSDFKFYAPSGNAPAAFSASPIYENGVPVGVLAFQLSVNQISAIMQERTGFGETGETYLVGTDLLFRSESRFIENSLLTQKVDTTASNKALAGETGTASINDYRGTPVLSSWQPFDFGDLHWAFIAEIDQSEAFAPATRLTNLLTGVDVAISIVIALIAAAIAVGLARAFSNPILGLTQTADIIAGGNFDVAIDVSREDELGTLSRAFKQMTERVRDLIVGLEKRSAELATVAEVGTATATILESKQLLQEVVDLTKERFNLYHSHIYLLDEKGENLVLTAGAGEPGRIMAAEKRSIPLDREQSLVARAARERKGVTVNDVTQAPDFLANPLLPDTRSELAVPMVVGNRVIGVFDIQSDQVGRFTDSDVNIQTTLASQLATSIQNVRSFEQSRKQAELESLVNTIGQKIQRTTSIEETLQTAIRELGTAIGASRVKASIGAQNGGDSASG
ncbi:MAG: GAF domain-containing protein [Chloroflexota bacterium]